MVFGMRRANGDFYAVGKGRSFFVPIFASSAAAMTARSRDPRMECFRAVEIGEDALQNFSGAHENPTFWLIADPLAKLNGGRSINRAQLARLVRNDHVVLRTEVEN